MKTRGGHLPHSFCFLVTPCCRPGCAVQVSSVETMSLRDPAGTTGRVSPPEEKMKGIRKAPSQSLQELLRWKGSRFCSELLQEAQE